ncbi:hypothetical protein HIR68_12190 [Staphylococcus coagulans]|nr:hypothetical protein [Staphylococcus coagulans]MBT2861063.1 hypothetical protein [Staphylococcus coagulans]
MSNLTIRRQKIRYQDFILFPLFVLIQYFSPILAEQYLPNMLSTVMNYHLTPEMQALLFNIIMFTAQLIIILLFIFLKRDSIFKQFQ